jgi:hypothetical protein
VLVSALSALVAPVVASLDISLSVLRVTDVAVGTGGIPGPVAAKRG